MCVCVCVCVPIVFQKLCCASRFWKVGRGAVSGPKNSLNMKFLGGIFLGHPGPRRRDIPDKNFMQVAFFCCFRQGVAGMSRDLGRDVPDSEKLSARKLWVDFSYLTVGSRSKQMAKGP